MPLRHLLAIFGGHADRIPGTQFKHAVKGLSPMPVDHDFPPVRASVSLTVDLDLEGPSLADCRARTARHLRRLALRIEDGEDLGCIHDRSGTGIGWFDLLPEDRPDRARP